eukprot:2825807-Amphidinium_carterae.1
MHMGHDCRGCRASPTILSVGEMQAFFKRSGSLKLCKLPQLTTILGKRTCMKQSFFVKRDCNDAEHLTN